MLIGLQIKHFPLLIWTFLIVLIRSDKINGSLSDARLITNLLEKIIKSKTESNNLFDVTRKLATYEDNVSFPEIENAIKLKVKELKPLLQDNDYNLKIKRRNNFKREESEETVIIERVPENKRRSNIKSVYSPTKQLTDTSQKNIKYYKQLRKNITKLLDKVNTANTTKKLITRTFDEMLALLVEQQCKKKSRNTTALLNHLVKDTRKSMPELKNIIEMMLKQESVLKVLEFHDTTGNITEIRDEIIPQLLLHMTELLTKYKLKCYLDRKQNPGAKNEGPDSGVRLRATSPISSSEKNEQCDSFIVCSNELTHFLKITYNSLKNTVISSYRNYTDLFMREVTETNKTTKDILISELKALNNITENECNEIFIKQLKLFTLDKNKSKIANILYVKDFLKVLGEKIIKSNNTGLVLNGNELCDFFVLCNGHNVKKTNRTRRSNKLQKFRPYKNVYVKVEHSLNDELGDSLLPFGEQILNSVQGDNNMISWSDKSVANAINHKKYSHVNVTRTTSRSTATTEGPGSTESVSIEYFF